MSYNDQNNVHLRPTDGLQGYCGGLTPLASPVARFTFDKKTPVKTSQAKISLRSSSGKKRRRGKGAAGGGNNFFKREMVR